MRSVDRRSGAALSVEQRGLDHPAGRADASSDPRDDDPIPVADDESKIAHVLRSVRESHGCSGLTSDSAEEGLTHLAATRIAVAHVDLVLPKMSGLQLLDEARRVAIEAKGGSDATARRGPRESDLVVTDLGMPDASRFEAAREAKDVGPGTLVILLSDRAINPDESRVREGRIDRVLPSPFPTNDLRRAPATKRGSAA